MDNLRLEIRESTPCIGAEFFGLDLSQSLSDQQFQAVHDALINEFACPRVLATSRNTTVTMRMFT